MSDLISRQAAIDAVDHICPVDTDYDCTLLNRVDVRYVLSDLPSAQTEEVTPHQNYKYLSDYWCACGWHLGKKGEVKYCADCGRKVNWRE